MHRLKQLHKPRLAVLHRDVALAEARHNLAEQRDLLHAARNQFTAFGDDALDAPAAFFAARERNDAERAILIATLHDADERAHGFRSSFAVEQMLLDGCLAPLLFRRIDDL